MKARTKGQKRRGRPRKEGVARTDSGRISRVKEQPSKLALEARARMHKITLEQAKDQSAGTFLGRLHMAFIDWEKNGKGKDKPQPEMSLTTTQYHALLTCQQLYNDRLKVVAAPGAYYEPHLGNSGDPDAHENWGASINKRWTEMRDAIQEAQMYDRANNLWAALDLCVLQELEMTHMIGSIRVLGNVLAHHFNKGPARTNTRSFHSLSAQPVHD